MDSRSSFRCSDPGFLTPSDTSGSIGGTMANFGGMGGVSGGRPRDSEDRFEEAVERSMGARLRAEYAAGERGNATHGFFGSSCLGARLWGSLANGDWTHTSGDTAGYSFRAAGDLIAAIVGVGDYMDWYCTADHSVCDPEVAELLGREGWRYSMDTAGG